MGLIKLLFHGKEINELEETLKLLLDKIRSIYNNSESTHFREHSNSAYFLRVEYGYGTIIKPNTDITLGEDIIVRLPKIKYCREHIIIVKKDDYNRFNEMSAEFSHKVNRYIQLLRKADTPIPTSMLDIIRFYKDFVLSFNYSYKYVVE